MGWGFCDPPEYHPTRTELIIVKTGMQHADYTEILPRCLGPVKGFAGRSRWCGSARGKALSELASVFTTVRVSTVAAYTSCTDDSETAFFVTKSVGTPQLWLDRTDVPLVE